MNARMSNWSNHRRSALRNTLHVVLGFALLPYVTNGQANQSQVDQLAASIARTKSGSFGNADVEIIARAGAGQTTLPELEKKISSTTDVASRNMIANALVRLGDQDSTYWNFLLEQATFAVENDVPNPLLDSRANAIGHELSPEISSWAQAHHVDVGTAFQYAMYDLPSKVMLLGETGDPRAIPLLRRALYSRNPMIVMMAAKGLAEIKDNESIPLIIEACRRSPKNFDAGIAEGALIFFDDPRAQSAVDTYVPKDRAKIFRDAKAHGLGPFGY